MQIFPIQLILASPASGGNDQAGDLFGGKFLGIDDDIEIAAVINIDTVNLKIALPIRLIPLQGSVKDRLVTGVFVCLSLKDPFRSCLERCMKPNPQISVDKPTRKPGTNNDAGPQRTAHQFQIGQEIVDSAFRCLSLDFLERNGEILGKVPKRIIDNVQIQGSPHVIRSRGIAAPAVTGNRYP